MSIAKAIRDNINTAVTLSALGNSHRKMRHLAADLINASGMDHEDIAGDCCLCESTVTNLASGKTKNPQSETLERVFKAFAFQLDMKAVRQQAAYANKPKK
jgi:hypothetical protein